MRIIKQSHEILYPKGDVLEEGLKILEQAGRVCYKSEDKIMEHSARAFVAKMLTSGHHSTIEHFNITVRFITDRGVTHELVRHRLASFSQESTRYCNYSKDKFGGEITVILPVWFDQFIKDDGWARLIPSPLLSISEDIPYNSELSKKWKSFRAWYGACVDSERSYLDLLRLGQTPQEARAVLPNSLKTEIVVTTNLREWRHILTLRTSSKAHPQIRALMIPLLIELKSKLPVIFDDIVS